MSTFYDVELATGATSNFVIVSGKLDVWVLGLAAGEIQLEVRFLRSDVEDPTTWREFPSGSFTEDAAKTVYVGEDQVYIRAVGTGNTDGVYVRFGRP